MAKIKKLTLKELKFTNEYIKNGGNGTQAVLNSYDTTNKASAATIAKENLNNPFIRERIEEAFRELNQTPKKLLDNLRYIAEQRPEPDKVSADAMIKANVEMLKIMGAYPGTKHTNLNLSLKGKITGMKFQDAKQELESMRSVNNDLVGETE